MELFENILTGEKSSKYKTNHFHMFVDDDVSIPDVENMSDDAFGTLIHEYVHYIQHITTLFGIRTCAVCSTKYQFCIELIFQITIK